MLLAAVVALCWLSVSCAAGDASGPRHQESDEKREPVFSEGFATSDSLDSWQLELHGGAEAKVRWDDAAAHLSAGHELAPNVWAAFQTRNPFPLQGGRDYRVTFRAKGNDVGSVFLLVQYQPHGTSSRLYFPSGDFDWTNFAHDFALPEEATGATLTFGVDDRTERLLLDDIAVAPHAQKWNNVAANFTERPHESVFPRTIAEPSDQIVVFHTHALSEEEERVAACLQGLVNRDRPTLYLVNRDTDAFWLDWLVEEGTIADTETVSDLEELLERFADHYSGAVVYDVQVPGSINAAQMIGSLSEALPASEQLARQFDLPVVEDLRGRWSSSVEAHRYVWENHWHEMSNHVIALMYPHTTEQFPRDYFVKHRVFTFWASGYPENEPAADVPAEKDFVLEVLAKSPVNIPIMGWWSYGQNPTRGLVEYDAMTMSSSYGKYLCVSEFSSNLSFLSALEVDSDTFRQPSPVRELPPSSNPPQDKIYTAISILDSGDSVWYWQHYQHRVWQDDERGTVPIGWALNPTTRDLIPPLLAWYYRNATPNDAFFCAISGIGYMNTAHYAGAFRAADREKVWSGYLADTRNYMEQLDLRTIGLYTGAWDQPTPPDEKTYPRYFQAIPALDGILSDFGRHNSINSENATAFVDSKPVFHTLTRWKQWHDSSQITDSDAADIAFTFEEITTNAPASRPATMSTIALSWTMFPSKIARVVESLPEEFEVILPTQLPAITHEMSHEDPTGQIPPDPKQTD